MLKNFLDFVEMPALTLYWTVVTLNCSNVRVTLTAYGPPTPVTVKVKLPLHLIKHHIMEVYRESEDMAPCIKLSTECCNNLKLSNVLSNCY